MPRNREGYIYEENGRIYARLSYTDKTGRHSFRRRARNRSHARLILKELIQQLEDTPSQTAAADDFNALADWYEANYAIEPVYSDGHKVAGLRGLRTVRYRIRLLREHFGETPIRSITYEQIRKYKLKRLDDRTPRGSKLSLQSIHRELAQLRRVLQLAVQSGKLTTNPFQFGDPLIVKAHERGRRRVLSLDEETRLLFRCADERAHLKPIIICALDTGMRAGEIFTLKWSDVDLPKRLLTVRAHNTKTLTERTVPISARLASELKKLWQNRFDLNQQLVLGIRASVSKAWRTATRKANVLDIRFHDLRHSFASRMAEANINPLIVALIMGHTMPRFYSEMTLHYTHLTPKMVEQVLAALAGIDEQRIGSAQAVSTFRVHKQ